MMGDEREGRVMRWKSEAEFGDLWCNRFLEAIDLVEQLTQERDAMKDAKETMLLEHLNEELDKAERQNRELEAALTSVLDNAMAHHAGEEGKARALAVIERAVRAVLSTSKEKPG